MREQHRREAIWLDEGLLHEVERLLLLLPQTRVHLRAQGGQVAHLGERRALTESPCDTTVAIV